MAVKEPVKLKPEQLKKCCDLSGLTFETTRDLEPIKGVIEQDRAVQALSLGLALQKRNYNVYVAGSSGTGKMTIVRSMLEELAGTRPSPEDWIYVHNFKNKEVPLAISLASGFGKRFKGEMDALIRQFTVDLPKAFQAKPHQEEVQELISESIEKEHSLFADLSRRATEHGFVVKSTKSGIITIPMVDDKIISNKDYEKLTENERKDIEERRKRIDPVINEFLQKARKLEAKTQTAVQKLQMKLGRSVISQPVSALKRRYQKYPKLKDYLTDLGAHVLENLPLFLPQEQQVPNPMEMSEYKVNVVVDNADTGGAPIIDEPRPTFYNLFGRIEKKVENGIYFTDFTMIKSGSALRASGGYLIVHANDLFMYPLVWENLKAILRYRAMTIEDIGENMGFLPTSGLRPEPIPIDIKVVLIGPYHFLEVLQRYDEDFLKLFQVVAEFDSEIRLTDKTIVEYSRFIATTTKNENLRPVDKPGVEALVEYGGRLVESQHHATMRFNEIANLCIEADFLAQKEGSDVIRRKHVEEAVRLKKVRRGLFEDKLFEQFTDEMVMLDTDGEREGVVNGLAVYQIGEHAFGKPARISAAVFGGKGGIINVEREARLSGPIHSKGVMIISGFLGDRLGRRRALSMTVSLAFEQSYGPIDGDSASAAELFAVLSSLSRVPLKQCIAVTGSVNQFGEIQPIGGVNEKIEGFYRLCKERGLTGTQGVMIPHSNVRNLMLNDEVITAVKEGKFSIYPIKTIEQGLEILTDIPAGEMNDDFLYAEDTIFGRCSISLEIFDEAGDDDAPEDGEAKSEPASGPEEEKGGEEDETSAAIRRLKPLPRRRRSR